MEYETREDVTTLSFVFEGGCAVDASAVTKALDGLATMTSAIANYENKDIEYRLAVSAFSPGSLDVILLAIADVARTLLTPDGISYTANLISIIKTCFEVKRFLNGKPLRQKTLEETSIVVENAEGARATFPKDANVIFSDQRVDNSITYIINGAESSAGVTGIRLNAHDKSVLIERESFAACAVPLDIESLSDTTIEADRFNEVLFVRQPDLLGDSKWGFRSDKNIVAEVLDKDFLTDIRSGKYEIFSGMYIVADMKVSCVIDGDGLLNENKTKYAVLKVHSVSEKTSNQIQI